MTVFFRCDGNSNINCTNIDDVAWSNTNWTQSSFIFDHNITSVIAVLHQL